jgi:hypothetical protein
MFNLPERQNAGCERFLEELESVPVNETTSGEVLARISEVGREHARACENCRQALNELVITRQAIEPLRAGQKVAGPWFTTRVMAAIAAKEKEIEERNGVWISVRRFAPRLVALCALLLVVGSTWALQLRRAEEARRANTQQAEGIFDTAPSAPVNDDATSILSSGAEARP